MPRANEIAVTIQLRDKFSAKIAKVRSGMKGLQSEWQGYMKVGAAAAVVSGVMAAGLMKCVQGAGKAAFAEERLQTLLNNVVKERDKNIKSLLDQAEAYEQLLGVEAEQTITVQAMLASFQLTKKQIMEATPRVLDIAAAVAKATGEAANYQNVAIGLGKALTGQVGALSRMGIVLSDVTVKSGDFNDIMADIDLNAKGAAKALGETFAAESAKLGHAFGMITDAIGVELIPVLRSLLKTITPIVQKFSEMPPVMTKIIALGGGVATVFTGIAGTGLMAAGGLGLVLNQVALLKKNYPGMIALAGKGTLALKTFGLAAKAMWGPIAVGVAAIILLRETFKAYNEMKDAQASTEDLKQFKKQAMEAAQNLKKYTKELDELAKQGITTGDEVDRLKERIASNIHKYEVFARKIGINTTAMDKYKLALAGTVAPAEKSIELQRLLAEAMGDTRKLGLLAINEHIAKMKEEGATAAEMLLARQAMTMKLEKEITEMKTEELRARETLEREFAERQMEEKRRLKEEERARWRERAEIIQGFYDEHMRLTEGDTAFQLEELKTQYALYSTYIEDKAALDEWYDAKKKKIIEASTTAEKGSFVELQDVFISGTHTLAGNWLTNMTDMEHFSEMSFRRMSDEFGKMIMNMVAKALILKTLELIPGFGGISAGIKLFGMKEGGIIGRPEGIPAQEGLMVYGPTRIIAGERGPEMITSLERFAEVVRQELNRAGGGGGGITINIDKAWDGASIADYFRGEGGRALLQATKEGNQIIHTRGIRT